MKKTTIIAILALILLLVLSSCIKEESSSNNTKTILNTATDIASEESNSLDELTSEIPTINSTNEWRVYLGTLYSPTNEEFDVFSPLILASYENRCLVIDEYRQILLVDNQNGSVVSLSDSQLVINYTVADDTIYWYNYQQEVWSSDQQSDDYTAKLFCENAIGVSPFTDENEGAIVEADRANRVGYGGMPIYSPFSEFLGK